MIEEKEKWRTISENEKYEVSNLGRIINKKTKMIRKNYITRAGYERICLSKHSKVKFHLVHRLVAQAFIPNPKNFPQVNHKDKNRVNNRVENLEWVNQSMNMKHCVETGAKRYKRPIWRRNSKGEVTYFDSIVKAAKAVGCSTSNISACLNGRKERAVDSTWGYVEETIKEEPRKDINWMEVKDYSKYRIYNNGQIYSKRKNGYLKPRICSGYYRVGLYSDNNTQISHFIHILVAKHFCENPDNKPIVNHKDGNRLNNHYTNLEWVTRSENSRHAHSLGLIKRVYFSKRVHQYAREDKDKCKPLRTFNSRKEVAEFLKLKNIKSGISNISQACRGVVNIAYGYRWGYEKIIGYKTA